MAVVMTLAVETSAAAASGTSWRPPTPKDVKGVAVKPVTPKQRPAWTASEREVRGAPRVTWPIAGTADVELAAARGSGGGGRMKAGALPVLVEQASTPAGQDVVRSSGGPASVVDRVKVEVVDRVETARAGVSGMVLKVSRADGVRRAGAVTVHVDYSGFAGAYGGDWSTRLRLVTLPDGKPLVTDNNAAADTLSAAVPLSADGSAVTLAVAAAASGDNGDYTATSLTPASTWQVSQQTGAFSWSYPLRVVPGVGGPEPSLAVSYSASSIDGRTGGTNTQGSWVGDGWDLWPGYVERTFKSCADDKDEMRGNDPNNKSVSAWDLCWLKPEGNATISLNGQAVELVKSSGNRWKGVADDGSKIELLTNTAFGNGDDNGEYWKVTTINGTQYFFGRNLGVGGASAGTTANSVWTVPVYGNHPDEPGYQAGSYAGSRTTQGWRWNLDYVVDPHGNTMRYFYERETGAYGREGDPDKRTTYDRGGYLTRIEYGNRSDASSSTQSAAQVVFDVAERCVSNCFSGTNPVAASWPDTPWDLYCKAAPCTEQLSPTFWTQKRLSRVRAQVYSGSGTSYNEVEWWTLRHTYLQAGTDEGKPMWLAGITRTGKVTSAGGPEVSDPEIVFDPGVEALPNRVDAMADGRPNLFRYRIDTITTESGARVAVTYSTPECTRSALPTVHNNNKRCYPQYYAPSGEEPTLDWFHKYVVTQVAVHDNTGGFSTEQTNYDYLDTPAWHYDDSELIDAKKRTWGQFRGYGKVRVRTGLESGVESAVEYLYLRGMDGDKQLPSGTKDVWVTDSQSRQVEDHEAYAGVLLEQTTLLGKDGPWISGTVNTPVKQGPTATSGPLKAWMTNTGTVRTRTLLANGTTRWTKTATEFNGDNLPTQVNDLGDEGSPDDDRCTRTWYARNDTNWMLDRIKRVESVGVNCSAEPTLPADMLSSVRTTYDAATNDWDTFLPVKGDVAKTEEIGSWTGGTPNWVTTMRSVYDANGRVTESRDALNRPSTTAYTPTVAGPLTSTTATNALGHSTTTTMAPAWRLPVTTIDNANGRRTDLTYDGLGRVLRVWQPGRAKTTYPNGPNLEFAYLIRNNASSAVTTKTLLPSSWQTKYRTSITLYDGLLRERQVQTQATGGGRVLTDTVYDSRGLVAWTSNPYYDLSNASPSTTLVTGTVSALNLTENVYDGAGRITDAILKSDGTEMWRTTTSYSGERTVVTPPEGGIKTESVVDARGKTIELRQYHSHTSATFDTNRYTYTDRGELATMVDAGGNTWRYTYDQRGRKVKEEDPDKGTTDSTYDVAGQLTTTTDDREVTLAYTYDDLGRKTSLRDDTVTGPKRAEWVYDTLQYGVGSLSKSIRYAPAGSTNAYINEITAYDPAGRPTTSKVTVPASEGGLCAANAAAPCDYTYTTAYFVDGSVANVTVPAAGGLAAEQLYTTYSDIGFPDGLYSTAKPYAGDTHNKLNQVIGRDLGQGSDRILLMYDIDEVTNRLTNAYAIPGTKPEVLNFTYTYDDAGNLTKISDQPAGGSADTQCYTYDHLRQLTEAWTPSSDSCSAAPSLQGLGGPAPYWRSYSYDKTGNRLSETEHASTNTVSTYRYPVPGGAPGSKPHAVRTVETTTGAVTGPEQIFTYDAAGNMTTRPAGTSDQELTWDGEGRLAATEDSTGTTSFVYDADGNRLIRRDPAGSTLYLPGGLEVRAPTSGAAIGTRYYSHAGAVVAMRTVTGVSWMVGDHHGTAEATINGSDLSVARRRTYPFGEERQSPVGTWPAAMDKGFVGGTKDNTGLTHLGAREYDPHLGRFISVDPIMDLADPQQWNSYAYGQNNPATLSDPAGLRACEDNDCNSTPSPGGGSRPTEEETFTPDGSGKTVGDMLQNGECRDEFDNCANKWRKGTGFNQLRPDQQADVIRWTICANDKELCDILWKAQLKADNKAAISMLLDVSGITDAKECAGGKVGGCIWTAVGLIPIGRLKVVKAFVGGAKGVKAFCSFGADTKVLMADGGAKPISEVQVGDVVMSTDPQTGKQGSRVVTQLWVHEDTIVGLRVDGETLETTEDHPFWNAADQQWQRADLLDPGDLLLTSTGEHAPVEGILPATARTTTAYNLTVTDIHTYYVLAGKTPVLVHNEGGDSSNPWSNSREWTQGRIPTSGGPENGVLYRRGAGGAIVDWGVYNERGNLRYRVDLFGAAHGGVETPHWQPYRENPNPKTGKVFVQETGEAFSGAGPVGGPPCGF